MAFFVTIVFFTVAPSLTDSTHLITDPRATRMDREQLLALLLYRRRLKRKRKTGLIWVHSINQRREEVGDFYTLFPELRNDEEKFFNYFRMSISSFDELHNLLENHTQRKNTRLRNCIQPVEMLAITLR